MQYVLFAYVCFGPEEKWSKIRRLLAQKQFLQTCSFYYTALAGRILLPEAAELNVLFTRFEEEYIFCRWSALALKKSLSRFGEVIFHMQAGISYASQLMMDKIHMRPLLSADLRNVSASSHFLVSCSAVLNRWACNQVWYLVLPDCVQDYLLTDATRTFRMLVNGALATNSNIWFRPNVSTCIRSLNLHGPFALFQCSQIEISLKWRWGVWLYRLNASLALITCFSTALTCAGLVVVLTGLAVSRARHLFWDAYKHLQHFYISLILWRMICLIILSVYLEGNPNNDQLHTLIPVDKTSDWSAVQIANIRFQKRLHCSPSYFLEPFEIARIYFIYCPQPWKLLVTKLRSTRDSRNAAFDPTVPLNIRNGCTITINRREYRFFIAPITLGVSSIESTGCV